ncbi:Protein KRI1-like [Holothuria leucospilota]|uniref:Protein KRI1 homolog n=1 Tax=Holothuria leucospilota TaxID=206669 RepID=A0A9Q1HC91_HOLLE|nr:Protein KRI1-like [Holothuria leucospilota]
MDVDSLRDYWSNPQLDEGEKFLRDYILDRAYKPAGDENEFENLSDEDLSEDDRLLDEQEDFERKYNFRYEEPDSEFVRSYPRNIEGSMRRKDTSRAKKRQEVKERKEKEKQKLHEELKKLKNLKKMEILEQLDKLKKVTGNTTVGFDEDDIKGDFDPNKHDELMKKIFNEEYDGLDEDKTKPVFEDEEFEEENWDEWTGYNDGYYENDKNVDGSQAHCEDPDFIMDADYDPEIHKKEKKKKKKKDKEKKNKETKEPTPVRSRNELDGRRPRNKHTSQFAKALQEKKPVFDPEDETFEEYFDEYYKLDYEDLIGDLPCRFKYRTVMANDFGLTPEEVLAADDKELNRWVSLKRTYQYRTKNEEFSDLHSFKEKGKNIYKKKQVFQSLYQPREDEEPEGEVAEEKEVKGEEEVEEEAENVREEAGEGVTIEDQSLESSNKKKKKEKKKREDMEENRDVAGEESSTVMSREVMKTEGEGEGEANGQVRVDERVQIEGKQEDRGVVAKQGPNRMKGAGKRKFMEELRNRKRRKIARKKEISEGRLKAYGVKPKAYKYKMIQNRIKDKRMKKVR